MLCWGIPIGWLHNVAKFNSSQSLCVTIPQGNKAIDAIALDDFAILFTHIEGELILRKLGVQVFHEGFDGGLNV
jgi:hypothetical protein